MFDRYQMSKRTITRLFIVASILVAAGTVTGIAAVIVALANGAVAFGGPQVVSFDFEPIAGGVVALIVASILAGVGTVIAIVSWAGALLNTSKLEDKTWFVSLLGLGLVSLGWLAMFAYVIGGPDSATSSRTVLAPGSPAQG